MKTLEKIALIIFSNIVLILCIVGYLVLFGWLTADDISRMIDTVLDIELATNTLVWVLGIFILLAVRCIFFDKESKEKSQERQGVLLENESGRLLISRETLESLIVSVTTEFNEAKNVQTKVELDKTNSLIVYINLAVTSDVSIKDMTLDIQNKIKEKVKKSTDLEVKQINVTIKKVEKEAAV